MRRQRHYSNHEHLLSILNSKNSIGDLGHMLRRSKRNWDGDRNFRVAMGTDGKTAGVLLV